MSEQKLRKFRLIDKEGFIQSCITNRSIVNLFKDGIFKGRMSGCGKLRFNCEIIILKNEFQFFEEIYPDQEDNPPQDPINQEEIINNDNETPSNEVYATFSDGMIHCIKEDCQAVNGSLCFYKEGVVFLWNEDEYFIESVDDYYKVINSIKVLISFKK